jgi:hypothetical protein
MNPKRYGEGGHYILKPDAAAVQRNFIPVKHGFTAEEEGIQAVQLPRGSVGRDNERNGIKDGALNLTKFVFHSERPGIVANKGSSGRIFSRCSAVPSTKHLPLSKAKSRS